MKIQKLTSVGGAYARKEDYEYEGTKYEADIKNGDKVKILNAGTIVTGEYGDQHVFSIMTRNGEKNANFNKNTLNTLVDEFGDESEDWVGKEVTVLTKKDVIAGRKVIIAYFVPEGYILDDYGELVKGGSAPTEEELGDVGF